MARVSIGPIRAKRLINGIISTEYSTALQVRKGIRRANSILSRMERGDKRIVLGKSLETLVMLELALTK